MVQCQALKLNILLILLSTSISIKYNYILWQQGLCRRYVGLWERKACACKDKTFKVQAAWPNEWPDYIVADKRIINDTGGILCHEAGHWCCPSLPKRHKRVWEWERMQWFPWLRSRLELPMPSLCYHLFLICIFPWRFRGFKCQPQTTCKFSRTNSQKLKHLLVN